MNQDDLRQLGKMMGQKLWGQAYFQRMETSGREMHPGFWDLALAAWSLYIHRIRFGAFAIGITFSNTLAISTV